MRYDMVNRMRASGLYVAAEHCPGCGKFAHVAEGNKAADEYWVVTDCKKCGRREVADSPVGMHRPTKELS